MPTTKEFTPADIMHRLVKQALDSGVAATVAEAEAMFRGYRLNFSIGASEARAPVNQAALLTGVALARRVFLGGVEVSGALDAPLAVPVTPASTLGEAVAALGGTVGAVDPAGPLVTIAGNPQPRTERFHVRTSSAGWRGGIVPGHAERDAAGADTMPLAAMLAASLAVNEAFLHVIGVNRAAGRRPVGLSLWRPSPETNWLDVDAQEPPLRFLPSRLWLIGLGHLGQAYLWGLGLLDYAKPSDLELVLQDTDVVTPSSESTSVLTESSQIGQKKTRAMAEWAERRGFSTWIYERAFDASFRRQPDEPAVALCGIDNAAGRRVLDQVGFDLVVEAGLGRGHRDFRTMRLHSLPGPRSTAELWKPKSGIGEELVKQRAYQNLLSHGELDRCGVTLLAGKAVGAPFVGAVASCLALSEVLRLLHGGPAHQLLDLDLEAIEHRTVVVHPRNFGGFNPGFAQRAE